MAMNGTLLGDELLAAIDAAVASEPSASQAQRRLIWRAIGNAIVAHITANAVVAVPFVSGVTVGGSNSGPGSGTVS